MKDYTTGIKGKNFIEKIKPLKNGKLKIESSRKFSKKADKSRYQEIIQKMEEQIPTKSEEIFNILEENELTSIFKLENFSIIYIISIITSLLLAPAAIIPLAFEYLSFLIVYKLIEKHNNNKIMLNISTDIYFKNFKKEVNDYLTCEDINDKNLTCLSDKTKRKINEILKNYGELDINNISSLNHGEVIDLVNLAVLGSESEYLFGGITANSSESDVQGLIINKNDPEKPPYTYDFNKQTFNQGQVHISKVSKVLKRKR